VIAQPLHGTTDCIAGHPACIPAYPSWSLVLVAIDVMIIYGLAAYGGKPAVTW
jgi:hypothetical protein